MMRQTWRWFGPADTIPIQNLRQIGVQGVVSALHHIPSGDVWTPEAIAQRQAEIREGGLEWEVVESVPVSEALKTRGPDWDLHIANYIKSLENLAAAGLQVICYNFMPVLDWTRTQLRWAQPHGGNAMRFDLLDFAVFDIHILARNGAADDFPAEFVQQAKDKYNAMSAQEHHALQNNIVAGLPGANDNWTLDDIHALLAIYADIDADILRDNLIAFLEAIIPTAERLGLRLCCHPDDPPFSLMGLPRIMSTTDDYAQIMDAIDSPANGITLCTGSLGVRPDVDYEGFIAKWGHRIHFVHLRNTTRSDPSFGDKYSFFEDAHLEGDTDMVAVIRALLEEQSVRKANGRADHTIPMRPDHGQELLDDLTKASMPGYPQVGRMRGLAELRGIMAALS